MNELLGAAEIRLLAQNLGVVPTKKLGQNFVIDPNTIRKIVAVAKLSGKEKVVEIGPGLGSLTLGLLEVVKDLVAVEVDSKMASGIIETVSRKASEKNFKLIHQDALKSYRVTL